MPRLSGFPVQESKTLQTVMNVYQQQLSLAPLVQGKTVLRSPAPSILQVFASPVISFSPFSFLRSQERELHRLKMPSFVIGAELAASAQKIWQAMKDAPLIIPKIAPHVVASIEHVDGPAEGVGAVRLTKLGPVAPAGAFVKERLVAIDSAAFTATTEVIEGGHLGQGFTKWCSSVKFTPTGDNSCNWETSVEYEGGNDAAIGPAIARAKEGLPKMMNGLCAYINNTA